jgi:ATP-dependent Lon protease
MKKAGTTNPIFVLDEVDKMSTDFRGDPSAALMEVLDPELNHAFTDHYLDVEYDLSKVMFVCTANVLHTIPQPLQDRMEILRIPGYTEQEKLQIAKRFLVKRQREATGLQEKNLSFTDDGLLHIIRHYTQEAGVRNLEREIQNISRKMARKVVTEGPKAEVKAEIVPVNVNDYLGVLKYREFWLEKQNEIGLTTGLAWTEVGGTVLTTEATLMEGKGRLTLTGKLGDVMQESAQAAMSYIRSRSASFGLPKDFYRNIDIHVHVPEGAIPKDGPSAGITICNSIVSALTRIPVRRDVTMTGEITLRGKVLPIGGVKEKLLAAHRMGLRTVLLPKDNEKDLAEIPQEILSALTIRFVETMDEVLQVALERLIVPIEHPAVAPVAEPFVAGAEKDTSLTN